MTDHLGDLRRRLQDIEDRSAAEHRRKVVVVAVLVVLVIVAVVVLWVAAERRQAEQDRYVCELTQTMNGMTPSEARGYCAD